jgi:Protein of unknown function (DUF5672)
VTASVAIIVPAFRERLLPDEELSLRHLRTYLGAYDGYVFLPESLDLELPGLAPVRLDDRHFRTHRAYSWLMLGDELYRRFERYEYVLVHQLDCLVFSDDLPHWCAAGWDYVGAPWVRRTQDGRPYFAGVGNGGLSLRRVDSFRRVCETLRRRQVRAQILGRRVYAVLRRMAREPRRARQLLRDRYVYEDKFWSNEAPRIDPSFRIPPSEVAVAFAFEGEPRFCLDANGGRLPFGCHNWRAHDPEFWQPHLLSEDR